MAILQYVRKNMSVAVSPANYHAGTAITSPIAEFNIQGTNYTSIDLYFCVLHSGNNTGSSWYSNFDIQYKKNAATSWTFLKRFGSYYPNNTHPIGSSTNTRYYVRHSDRQWKDGNKWHLNLTNVYSLQINVQKNAQAKGGTDDYNASGDTSIPNIMRVNETINGTHYNHTGKYTWPSFEYTFVLAAGPYVYHGGKWYPTIAWIYHGGWKPCTTWIYHGTWKQAIGHHA